LKLPEAALLAGLPKAPSNYSPFLHYEKAKQRQVYVLTRMMEDGYISRQEMEQAIQAPLKLRPIRPKDKIAAYFVENVRRYVQEKYGADVLYKEGLSIYTTLDLNMQKYAGEAMERGLKEVEERNKYQPGLVQGALYCMDVRTGANSGDGRRTRFQLKASLTARRSRAGNPVRLLSPLSTRRLLIKA